ncbi:Fic family protein [Candidatus Bathyarchaeota archaeon]|nr:Fic family protein [Candidatus Bathyarchaeota archaeon]
MIVPDIVHKTKSLHPIIAACQLTAYFVHIHPFPDGNGRVSRMLMHDGLQPEAARTPKNRIRTVQFSARGTQDRITTAR